MMSFACWLLRINWMAPIIHYGAYMMRHVLVAKGLWNIVQGYDVRPIVAGTSTDDARVVEDAAGSSLLAHFAPPPPPPPPTA